MDEQERQEFLESLLEQGISEDRAELIVTFVASGAQGDIEPPIRPYDTDEEDPYFDKRE